jgi:hypothetical protein
MAEIRTHDSEGGSDLGRLVREALGETIRPVMPGSVPGAVSPEDETDAEQGASLTSLPQWTGLSINVADT